MALVQALDPVPAADAGAGPDQGDRTGADSAGPENPAAENPEAQDSASGTVFDDLPLTGCVVAVTASTGPRANA